MPKITIISARIDPELEQGAESMFQDQGLPFAVWVPNDETVAALEQARTRQDLEIR